ncbi:MULTISPECIES: DUF1007 family protein [unclassified Campylobacter]|uniref:HoxN/HupN/NixA family nickel/cobalt transporter n=1 Tax=unclassified Campylobacter TaxID=2593542 RepID=UPI001473B7F3|nr:MULTISPECIES: DUF1007 family protein [unclassified Campylobacter]
MMKFGRILAALTLFASIAYSCALCALYTPTAHAQIKFDAWSDTIKTATITWTFSENFTELTMQGYDEDADKNLNEKEAWNVQKSLLDYIVPRGYLTTVSFYDGEGASENLFVKTKSQRVYIEENRLNFEYVLELNLEILPRRVVVFEIIDREGFFNFKIANDEPYRITESIFIVPNSNLNTVFFEMSEQKPKISNKDKPELSSLVKNKNLEEIDAIDEAKFNSLARTTIGFLDRLKELIKENSTAFEASKFALIMLFSFVYGFLHAAGPGHGKLLTTSYFAASGGSYLKAFGFSLKIGILHVLGALMLVWITMSLLESFAANVANSAANLTTKISALIIMAISAYMIFTKLKSLKPKVHNYKFSPHKADCGCAACKAMEVKPKSLNEWFVALAASLVPCPGTIIVFILAFSLNSWLIGVMSGVFMALGMSIVIFIAAVFGTKVNALSKYKNLKIYCEFLALLVMFGLGAFMFFIAGRISVL